MQNTMQLLYEFNLKTLAILTYIALVVEWISSDDECIFTRVWDNLLIYPLLVGNFIIYIPWKVWAQL